MRRWRPNWPGCRRSWGERRRAAPSQHGGCDASPRAEDFGTGYSSLAHLRHIPARQLKIDRSFVVDLTASVETRAVVEAIVQLAHAMKMEVAAEGVESDEQLQVLRDLGCNVLQGFHIASPMPADDVPVWMSTRENARREGVDTSLDTLPGHMTQFLAAAWSQGQRDEGEACGDGQRV